MNEWDVRPDPPCVACGKRHIGAGTAEMNCLRAEVIRLRGQIVAARHVAGTYLHALGPGR